LARGLLALADAHGIELVGGDTTAGPLNLCITVFGQVPPARRCCAAARGGRRPVGQRHAGRRAAGAGGLPRHVSLPGDAFEPCAGDGMPQPRVALGLALRGLASSAIDCQRRPAGRPGPCAAALGRGRRGRAGRPAAQRRCWRADPALQHECLLAGGDDYELLFTAPPPPRAAVQAAGAARRRGVTRIGRIEPAPGLVLVDAPAASRRAAARGFDHFA
jgi:thiamine-monophosphate kinase